MHMAHIARDANNEQLKSHEFPTLALIRLKIRVRLLGYRFLLLVKRFPRRSLIRGLTTYSRTIPDLRLIDSLTIGKILR
jgi:hypothetical protein